VIHFMGGFVAGSAAPLAYGRTLSTLADAGYLIVVSSVPALQTNHSSIAASAASNFARCYYSQLLPLMGGNKDTATRCMEEALQVPIVGLSHSLGGKIMALMGSRKEDRRKVPTRIGNVFMAFNNYGFQQSLEMSQTQAQAATDPRLREAMDAMMNDSRPELQGVLNAAREIGGAGAAGAVGDMLYGALGSMAAVAFDTVTARGGKSGGNDGDAAAAAADADDADDARNRFSRAVADRLKKAVGEQVDAVSAQVTDKITEVLSLEFEPSPSETFAAIRDGYNVQSNVLIRFCDDDIDQSHQLEAALHLRGGCDVEVLTVAGGHLTPVSLAPLAMDSGSSISTAAAEGTRKRRLSGDRGRAAALGMDDGYYDDDDDGALDSLNIELLRQINKIVMEQGGRVMSRARALPATEGRGTSSE
jgi:hypothetical protein